MTQATEIPRTIEGNHGGAGPEETPARRGYRVRRGLRSRWQYVRHYQQHDRLFSVGLVIVGIALFLAAFGPLIVPYDPTKPDLTAFSQPPSWQHFFGTDNSGLDVFSRTLAAPRVDVVVAMLSVIGAILIGSMIGLVATYFEGPWGSIVMRSADVTQAFPLFVLAMIIVVTAGRSTTSLIGVIIFLSTPIYIRLMRSQVLSLKHSGFVEGARAVGVQEIVIAFRHVYPNAITPSVIQASITMGWAIILTAGLSFVGAGIRPPTPEWGAMIAVGANQMINGEWWSAVFPGIAMSLTVFGFAIVGESLNSMRRGVGK